MAHLIIGGFLLMLEVLLFTSNDFMWINVEFLKEEKVFFFNFFPHQHIFDFEIIP